MKPWMEAWSVRETVRVLAGGAGYARVIDGPGGDGRCTVTASTLDESEARARLAAAAPALVRALLAVEWGPEGAVTWRYCSACEVTHPDSDDWLGREWPGHAPSCPVDAALTAAGLETQEMRDGARREMGRAVK